MSKTFTIKSVFIYFFVYKFVEFFFFEKNPHRKMSGQASFPQPGKRLFVIWTSSYGGERYGFPSAIDKAFCQQHKYDKPVIKCHPGGEMDQPRVERMLNYMRSKAPHPQVHLILYGNFSIISVNHH